MGYTGKRRGVVLLGNEVEGYDDKCEWCKGDADVNNIKELDWIKLNTAIIVHKFFKIDVFLDDVDLEDNL